MSVDFEGLEGLAVASGTPRMRAPGHRFFDHEERRARGEIVRGIDQRRTSALHLPTADAPYGLIEVVGRFLPPAVARFDEHRLHFGRELEIRFSKVGAKEKKAHWASLL